MEILRRSPDEEGAPRVAVRIPGVGSCWLGEQTDLPERIRRAFPELSEACARRAVALVEAELGQRNRRAHRGQPERPSWVWSWAQ
jgi:hypothetical protein